MRGVIDRIDKALLAALCCIVVLLLGGALYSRNFLSLGYLLQQLQVASFLGVIATGVMLVILLGHIDLSIPWVVTMGGMMSTAAAGRGGMAGALAIPFAIACGLGIGLINGIGVDGSGWVTRVTSRISMVWDSWIVDGLVNLAARIVWVLSFPVRMLQTGRVSRYALFMLLGVMIFLGYYFRNAGINVEKLFH